MTDNKKPRIVKTHDIHIDAEYAVWIAEVKHRYRTAQVNASVKVNAAKLLFNWQLGRDLVLKKAEERWGAGVVEQVSLDMKREFPESNNFSTRNLWYMKQWYLFYTDETGKLKQPVSEIAETYDNNKTLNQLSGNTTETEILKQSVSEFPLPFAYVPWGHHVRIVQHSQTLEEALFYVNYTIQQGITRDILERVMGDDIYNKKTDAPNNFTEYLTDKQLALAQQVVKENYDFGFATVSRQTYDEQELEDSLCKSIEDLLLELGTGFAFIGRQKEILVGGRVRKIDLLFYHIRLHCYIVCELKARPFEPEFAGKLNFYVNAVDELLKQPEDNPTIGLLICSNMNTADVKWSFKGINTPMGVATYNNVKNQDALPSQEQLAERVLLLQKELQESKKLINNPISDFTFFKTIFFSAKNVLLLTVVALESL